jgi:hypothetical protein
MTTRKYEYGLGDWEYQNEQDDTEDVLIIIETKDGFRNALNYTGKNLIEALNNAGQEGWHFCGHIDVGDRHLINDMVFMRKVED